MLASKYQDYMFGLLKKVIDEIGPRPSCSEAEKKLGRLLVEEWKPICDRVDVEPFTCSPHAWLGSIPLSALLGLAAIIIYWFLPPLALTLGTVIFINVVIFNLDWKRESIDFFFPRKQGENIVATIQPRSEPTQRVIVSGHMDSAYEANILYYLKGYSPQLKTNILMAFGFLAIVVVLFASLAKTLAYFNVFSNDAALTGVGIALIVFSPLTALFLFYTSWKPVPGAADDMAGVSIVSGLGKCLGETKMTGEWFPEKTEVLLLATSSEECGHRGAKRYVKKHLKEMKAIRTYFLALDGFCGDNTMKVAKGESSTGAKHDPELVRIAQEATKNNNWPIVVVQPGPPHVSDASRFSLAGIPATWLSAYDLPRIGPNFHTRYDTYEHVRPESLSAMLQLVIDMIERIDKG